LANLNVSLVQMKSWIRAIVADCRERAS